MMTSVPIDTITLNSNYYSAGAIGSASTITLTGGNGGTFSTINNINSSISFNDFKINLPEEWVDCFPDFKRIEDMCKEYPGLKIAYDQFKTVYALVRDDYDTPKDKRVKP